MSTSQKRIDDANRLKYVRVLDKFIRACIGYLVKEQESTFEGLVNKVEVQSVFLKKVEPIVLYKEELIAKEAFVKMLQNAVAKPCEDFEALRSDLLYQSNQLHKDQNRRKYKKEKHTKSKFKDWE